MKLAEYRKIAPALNADLAKVFEKYGLKLNPVRASIDERGGSVSVRLTAADVNHKGADGKATTPERETYKQLCALYDMKPEWLDLPFANGRETLSVVGLKSRGRKIVVLKRERDGALLVSTPDLVIGAMLVAERRAAS